MAAWPRRLGRNGSSTLTYTYDANGNQITAIDSSVPRTTTNTYYADNLMRTNQDYTAGRVYRLHV